MDTRGRKVDRTGRARGGGPGLAEGQHDGPRLGNDDDGEGGEDAHAVVDVHLDMLRGGCHGHDITMIIHQLAHNKITIIANIFLIISTSS